MNNETIANKLEELKNHKDTTPLEKAVIEGLEYEFDGSDDYEATYRDILVSGDIGVFEYPDPEEMRAWYDEHYLEIEDLRQEHEKSHSSLIVGANEHKIYMTEWAFVEVAGKLSKKIGLDLIK